MNPKVLKIVLSCSVIGLFALMAIASGSRSDSTVDLKASISFSGTQFVIVNNDSLDWTEVKFELNDTYKLKADTISAGKTYTVGALQFAKDDGTRFNPLLTKPTKLSISCHVSGGKRGFYYCEWK